LKRLTLEKIISGGQTGVDRAALDVALELGVPCGGWCPKGRKAEDGCIPDRYPLQETPFPDYKVRTEWNVKDSDGTLILTSGKPTGGTALTITLAEKYAKPNLILVFSETSTPAAVRQWLSRHNIRTLNVAGPRESEEPRIYEKAVCLIRDLLTGRDPKTTR
jgi:predicted Rossmann-fold nucleotide-binding protein